MPVIVTEYPQFFTASIKGWYKLLEHDQYKDIIVNSLRFLVKDKRIQLYAFVIMPDHIHLIWQMQPLIHPQHVQRDFLKYTAQRIKNDLYRNHRELLSRFETDANDRAYQFWKRRGLTIELRTHKVYLQKLNYIHQNPVKANLCKLPAHLLGYMNSGSIAGGFLLIIGIELRNCGGWKKNTRHIANISTSSIFRQALNLTGKLRLRLPHFLH